MEGSLEGKITCDNCGSASFILIKGENYCTVCGKKIEETAGDNKDVSFDSLNAAELINKEKEQGNSFDFASDNNISEIPQTLTADASTVSLESLLEIISPSPQINQSTKSTEGLEQKHEDRLTLQEIKKEIENIENRIASSEELSKEIDAETKPFDEISLFSRKIFKDINRELKDENKKGSPKKELPDNLKKNAAEIINKPVLLRGEKELENLAHNFIDKSVVNDKPIPMPSPLSENEKEIGSKNIDGDTVKNQDINHHHHVSQWFKAAETNLSIKPANKIPQKSKKEKKKGVSRPFIISIAIIFIALAAGAAYYYLQNKASQNEQINYNFTEDLNSNAKFVVNIPQFIPEGFKPRSSNITEGKVELHYYYVPEFKNETYDVIYTQEVASLTAEKFSSEIKENEDWKSLTENDTEYFIMGNKIRWMSDKFKYTIDGPNLSEEMLFQIALSTAESESKPSEITPIPEEKSAQ
ncbi:TPA: hypothetical protein DDW69_01840 [candidate division CPR2 bacterium]|nr:MAG: hypothetical protein A2Y27_01815 [candidate division CPR2 bacterium GWD1_39_7]HBG81562.1 hypothetical protein [candidate division CPR2 bacterium]HCL99473.1 hypothetical protein [candidate division CPR2 bacterium]